MTNILPIYYIYPTFTQYLSTPLLTHTIYQEIGRGDGYLKIVNTKGIPMPEGASSEGNFNANRRTGYRENQALVLLYMCNVQNVMCIDNVIVQRHGSTYEQYH